MPIMYPPGSVASVWVPDGDADRRESQGWTYELHARMPNQADDPDFDSDTWTGPPSDTYGESSNVLPGQRLVFEIDGVKYLVWKVPVDADGDGVYDEYLYIRYTATDAQLAEYGVTEAVTQSLTSAEWAALGGLQVGDITELRNVEDNPFDLFVNTMLENANLYPWLLDPEIMALTGAAWLEGRAITAAELAGTAWWKSHSDAQREWLALNAQDPTGAKDLLRDNRIVVAELLRNSGVSNAPDTLVTLLADLFTRGDWSDTLLTQQIGFLADPAKKGDLESEITDWMEGYQANIETAGFELDTTQVREDRVKQLINQWLGPAFGQWSNAQIEWWAGTLRNDPDGELRLIEELQRQRLVAFPTYTDPNLTYEDISSVWRNYFFTVWGQAPDETDSMFVDIINLNDMTQAGQILRREGLSKGIGKVRNEMLGSLGDAFGDAVVNMGRY
jgi:hypothetical protein